MWIYVAILIDIAIALLVWWWWPRKPSLVGEFDAAVQNGSGGGVFTDLATEAALAFKEKHGELRYNAANRLLAGEFCRKWLRDEHPDLRRVDAVMHATYAVELALTPLEFSVHASGFAADAGVRSRRGYAGAK